VLERVVTGHRSHKHCVKGKARHKSSCTIYTTVFRIRQAAANAGKLSIALPTKVHGHKLALGRYRVTITPSDAAGHSGRPSFLTLTLVRR
jgi:hypothetical protein